MRKVFSSQRLANVEAVAELLRAEGIAIRISDGRSYRSSRRANFSYDARRTPEDIPSVWILRSEDQPRGRQLLREMGLLESTRDPGPNYLPSLRPADPAGKKRVFTAGRVRLALLVLTVAGIGLVGWVMRKPGQPATAAAPEPATAQQVSARPAPPPLVPEAVTELQVYRADVPTELARLLLADALGKRRPGQACVAIDGGDPAPALLESLRNDATRLFRASDCPKAGALAFSVEEYLTDGSGSGQVRLTVGDAAPRLLDVERNGRNWRVVRRR